MREYTAQLFSETKHRLAESPFYDPRVDCLSWVDILGGKLYWRQAGEEHCFDAGEPIGAAVPLKDGDGFILAGRKALWRFVSGEKERVLDLSGCYEEWQRSNDAKADPRGRLFFGSSAEDGSGREGGDLYRYDQGGLAIVQPDTRISNGMAWNRAHNRFYFSDSLEHAVFVYDYDEATGEISNRSVLFDVEEGIPDGLCIDAEDRIWVAIWGGSRIECHDGVSGELLAVVRVPAEHTTSCCFCGEKMDTLFITTAGDGLDGPGDGRLYLCKVDEEGLPPDGVVLE